MSRFWVILLCSLSLPATAGAQAKPHAAASSVYARNANSRPSQSPAEYSQEPFIIESYATTARFENDGTGEQTLAVRVRVQSEAGAQQLHELVFRYVERNQEIKTDFLRVRKADGSVVNASADDFKDVAVVPEAAYAQMKERRLSVPPLAPGDTLEYRITTRILAPFAPGEFWFTHNFVAGSVVRDETLEISVPAARKVILKSAPSAPPFETSTANGRTIYRWRRANSAATSGDAAKEGSDAQKSKSPDVQLSSFTDWNALAHWYANLARDMTAPTPELLRTTSSLMHEHEDSVAKAKSIYDFVSTTIRSVDIPLGQAGWHPHSAAEVLANKYGDSADQSVLLSAMLRIAGFNPSTALIPYSRALDASVPSPAQLEHAMTMAPWGPEMLWMDPTPEVASFRMLAAPLRKKSALLISADGAGKIVVTPSDPPFVSTQQVDIDGHVSDLGKLVARAHYAMRGDTELVLRLAFHRTPQAQWNDLGQTILSLDGIHGEVTSVKPGDPMSTDNPFELDINFTQSNFLDWSSKRANTQLPLLAIGLPDPPEDATKPIELGSRLDVTVKLKLSLPPIYTAQPPASVSIARDYAEFKSSYHFADGTVSAERSLDFKMRTLPATRVDDYREFARAVAADQNRTLVVINTAPGEPAIPSSATADDLVEAGLASLNAGNAAASIPLFSRAVQLDPQQKQAWNDLGLAYLRTGKPDEASTAFQKQLEINPADEHANAYLGLALERQNKDAEAAAAFRKQVEISPLDAAAHAALGEILLAQHEYAQAALELDKATILAPDSAELQVSLGRAYLNSGQQPKAIGAFEKAVALSPTAPIWNDAAFVLAEGKLELDKAQGYAESAVGATAASIGKIDLQHVSAGQLREITSLAACWDTLGWVHFQKGDLEIAERYIRAAWLLDQSGEIGDHLAQIDEKRGEKDRAIEAYALALAAPHSNPETRARLTLLLGGNSQIDDLVAKAAPRLAALRSIPAGKLLGENAQADFFVALSTGEKTTRADGVRFISGSDALRTMAEKLRTIDYGEMFPNGAPVKIIRRATLVCTATSGDCVLILIPAGDAHVQ